MSQQIDQTIAALEFFSESGSSHSIAEIASQLSASKSGTHRLMTRLVERGYVEQDQQTQRYRGSVRLAVLGLQYLSSTGLKDIYLPELRRLANASGELVRLAAPQGDRLFFVSESQGATRGLRFDANLGREVVLHAMAGGKAWLSTMPEDQAVRYVLAAGFERDVPLGPNAISDIETLLADLRECRKLGYAVASEEAEVGVTSIAAPIIAQGAGDEAVASVIIVAPSVRMTEAHREELIPRLIETAKRLGELWPLQYEVASAADEKDKLNAV